MVEGELRLYILERGMRKQGKEDRGGLWEFVLMPD